MTKTLIATKELVYDAKKRNPGDQFNATDLDAVILTAHDVFGGPKARHAPPPDAPTRLEPMRVEPKVELKVETQDLPEKTESTDAIPIPVASPLMTTPASALEPAPEATSFGETRRRYKRRDREG